MVLLDLGTLGLSGACNVFKYNRSGWLNDVRTKQIRRHQRQLVHHSQAEMFREDVRDLVGVSVTMQGNYVLIATLILGLIAQCYIQGPVPPGTREFVTVAYTLCLTSSLVCIVFSVLCTTSATSLASTCQKDLLLTLVRVPVEEFVAEIDGAVAHESSEAFERQELRRMLRLPGLSRLRLLNVQAMREELEGSSRSTSASRMHGRVAGGDEDGSPVFDRQDQQANAADRHLKVFHEKELEWVLFDNVAFFTGALGISNLLQAYGYFSAAKYYEGHEWASSTVQLIMFLTDAVFVQAYMLPPASPEVCCGVLLLKAGAPLACTLAIRCANPDWLGDLCVPLCFLCHLLWSCFCCWRVFGLASNAGQAAAEAASSRVADGGPENFAAAAMTHRHRQPSRNNFAARHAPGCPKVTGAGIAEEGWSRSLKVCCSWRSFLLIFSGEGVVIFGWLATLCWALYHDCTGSPEDLGLVHARPRELQASAMLRSSLMPREWPTELAQATLAGAHKVPIALNWPTSHFRPHTIACGSGGSCFAADEEVILEWHFGDGVDSSLTPVSCTVEGSIADVAARCEWGHCRPMALVRGPQGAALVDCDMGQSQQALLQGGDDTQRMTVNGGTEMFTAAGGHVVQRAFLEPPTQGWTPLWSVADVRAEDLASLHFMEDSGSLLLFFRSGAVQAVDPDSGAARGGWDLGVGAWEVLSGAAVARHGAAHAVVLARPRGAVPAAAPAVYLWRVELPGLAATGSGAAASARARQRAAGEGASPEAQWRHLRGSWRHAQQAV